MDSTIVASLIGGCFVMLNTIVILLINKRKNSGSILYYTERKRNDVLNKLYKKQKILNLKSYKEKNTPEIFDAEYKFFLNTIENENKNLDKEIYGIDNIK